MCREADAASRPAPGGGAREGGFTIVEVILAAALSLIVAIGIYEFFSASNRQYVLQSDRAAAQNTARAALDLFMTDLRAAGYAPLGAPFIAVPGGDATRIRVVSDRDGDGIVGAPGEAGELLSYVFSGPDASGLYELRRGVDINGDWVFTGPGESISTVAASLVRVDFNGDGTPDPFLAYDVTPPAGAAVYDPREAWTSRVTVTFGVRADHKDLGKGQYPVIRFRSDVSLRNRF